MALEIWGEPFKRVLAKKVKKRRLWQKRRLFFELNSKSSNPLAEATFRAIGEYQKTTPQVAIRNYLKRQGVPTAGLVLVDGSGRSRKNRVTPLTFVRLLNSIYFSSQKRDFIGSLAVAGKRGTLKNRLLSLKGMVYAKTGYLRGVNALSGYLLTHSGDYSFSIIVNERSKNFSNWELIERLLSFLKEERESNRLY